MSEKELEERVLISKKQFLELEKNIQENYPNYVVIHQKNRYLDDASFSIRNNHNMLRIRSFPNDNKRELTYKVAGLDGDIEYNQPLTYYWFTNIRKTLGLWQTFLFGQRNRVAKLLYGIVFNALMMALIGG